LADKRELTVKKNVQIQPSREGVTYCGYRILQGAMKLSRRRKQRFLQQRQYWEDEYEKGHISAQQLQANYAAVHSMVVGTNSVAWRQENLRQHPPIEV